MGVTRYGKTPRLQTRRANNTPPPPSSFPLRPSMASSVFLLHPFLPFFGASLSFQFVLRGTDIYQKGQGKRTERVFSYFRTGLYSFSLFFFRREINPRRKPVTMIFASSLRRRKGGKRRKMTRSEERVRGRQASENNPHVAGPPFTI